MSKQELETGDIVRCSLEGCICEGTYITARKGMATVKLTSGYNIGVPSETLTWMKTSGTIPVQVSEIKQNQSLPLISIVSTGGTIASRIDYRTGAVTSQFRATDILNAIPGLGSIAHFRAVQLCNILSENMTPAIWQELAKAVYDEIKAGAEGVLVTHGTDTMAYSAAAVSFMIRSPVPVVFTGSQRSADRPSSDNVMNGMCAAATALSDLGEVVVLMHASTSDDICAIHRGTRVRKMHTSRRDAFRTIGSDSIGTVDYPSLKVTLGREALRRGIRDLSLFDRLEERCGIIWYYPGMDPEILSAWRGYKGIILTGTGLGHVGTAFISRIRDMISDGTMIFMISQCLHGRVCDRVYDTGRDLLDAGVIEGEDLLPEVALVKLMWVLGQGHGPSEAAALMKENLVGELSRRSQI